MRAFRLLYAGIPLAIATTMLGLAGCMPAADTPQATPQFTQPIATPVAKPKIGVLVPLSGSNAAIGVELLHAAQLALGPGAPQLDVQDTASTPAGATAAAQAAVAAHDAIIIGPLTAPETAAAAAVANGTPILAFTSDPQQARPRVWVLGITPQQQVARLVTSLSNAGKTRLAAVLPDNAFGAALADGLTRSTADAGDPAPAIRRYADHRPAAMDDALRDVSDYSNRRGLIEAQVNVARESQDPAQEAQASTLAGQPVPPPGFDALLLAESGPTLAQALAALPKYDIALPDVRVIGPATWARDAASVPALTGAWYAAADPAERGAFQQAFVQRYGAQPPAYADFAYDAARLATAAVSDPAILTRTAGFRGVDGVLALRADGTVRRGLAVFEIAQGKARIIDPAPAFAPGS